MVFKGENEIIYATGIEPSDLERLIQENLVKIEKGVSLDEGDNYKAVIGYSHGYGDIWEKSIKLKEKIIIEGIEFKVVGIIKKVGNPIDDGLVYIPKDTLKEILSIDDEESQIIVKTSKGFNPEEVAEEIERKLRRFRGEKEGQETFTARTSEQAMQIFTNIFNIVQAVLVGIAAISLLVGGVGIMNTMYTSVLERTKEIGTMKAIGAKNSQIMTLFLFEAGLLGLVGGIIGVGIGGGIAKIAEIIAFSYLGTELLKANLSVPLVVGALLFSFIIGSLSGILPAYQASNLKPVDALRYE
jgi:putative ABC transport system permease protein